MEITRNMKTFNIICIFVLFFLTPDLPVRADEKTILIINSNASVKKYKTAQEEFVKTKPGRVLEFDLESGAANMTAHDPDLVYCIGSKAYFAANKHFGKKKIVFSSIINWERLPKTKGKFGVSNELHPRMPIMMVRYLFPDIKKIGMLYSKKFTQHLFEKSASQAKELGIEIVGKEVGKKPDISDLKRLIKNGDAFWLISDPLVLHSKGHFLKMLKTCDAAKKPVLTYKDSFVKIGAVLAVSVDDPTIGRQAAGIAMEALEKGRIDEKVQFPAGSRVTLNMGKVKKYKMKCNENALGSVNDIIK